MCQATCDLFLYPCGAEYRVLSSKPSTEDTRHKIKECPNALRRRIEFLSYSVRDPMELDFSLTVIREGDARILVRPIISKEETTSRRRRAGRKPRPHPYSEAGIIKSYRRSAHGLIPYQCNTNEGSVHCTPHDEEGGCTLSREDGVYQCAMGCRVLKAAVPCGQDDCFECKHETYERNIRSEWSIFISDPEHPPPQQPLDYPENCNL